MTRDEILDVIVRWLDTFARRDLDAYARLYSEDCVFESPLAGSGTGRAAVHRVIEAFATAFPDAVVSAEPALIDDDRVALVCSVAGTNVGSFMGLPSSGKAFRFSMVVMLVVRDGHIVSDRKIYDFTGFLVQLGILKAKPA